MSLMLQEEAAISTRTRSQVSQRNLKRPLDSPPDLQTRPKVAVITRAGTRQARSKEPGACADQAVADGTQSRQKNAAVEKEDPLTLENKHVTVDPSVCSAGNIVMDTDTNADGVTARQAAGPLVHAEPEVCLVSSTCYLHTRATTLPRSISHGTQLIACTDLMQSSAFVRT